MLVRRILALPAGLIAVLSCSRTTTTSTPASTPAPAPQTANASGQPAGPPRRLPLSRDSAAKLRAGYVEKVMASIAGKENQPAEQVFKNIQVLKGITAAELV